MIEFCYYWGVAGVPWNDGNWTWAECELVQEICAVWGTKNVWWKNANWWWSQCTSSIPPIPPTPPFQMPPGIDATIAIQPWQAEDQWNPYRAGEFNKRKRLIKLICKVKADLLHALKGNGFCG